LGTDNFHQKRKKRSTKQTRVEKKSILIALEDTKSSKYYFQKLLQDQGFRGEVIIAKHIGTNPKKVLEALTKHKQEHPKEAFEKEWIVIDKDDWSKDEFNGTLEEARQKNICVAFSNEAYELWLLLHFEKVSATTSRDKLKSKLNQHFIEKFQTPYSKATSEVYKWTKEHQATAIKHAKSLIQQHKQNHGKLTPYEHNPLTMIHQLVLCLNTFYDTDKKCDCFPLS
jgi:hypothetical protein